MSDLLNISESPRYDESITRKAYHTYTPFIESYNINDVIRICIQNQDLILLPSESVLYVEGTLFDDKGSANDNVQLTNNCVAFMFDEIRYELNGIEIDHVRNLGITSSMKNYISINPHESAMFRNAGWSITDNRALKISDGLFNYCVPLAMLLGFAEDYKKIVPNAKHELVLIRAKTNNNSVATTIAGYQFKINKIAWKMPHIALSDAHRLKLYQTIQGSRPIQMSFRSWDLYEYPNLPNSTHHIWRVKTSTQLEKPRFIIFALQTNKMNNIKETPSEFNHCKLSNFKVHLNSEVYPYDNLNVSYESNRYALVYHMYSKFQESYYGISSSPLLDSNKFKNVAPIMVVDCLHQSEVIKSGPVDVKIEFETLNGGIVDNTSAFCLLLHDRLVEYSPLNGDVKKLV